jgi:hypothetical protein
VSTIAAALKAVREVLLLQNQVERLDDAVGNLGRDLEELADLVGLHGNRLSRLEGMIEAWAMAGRAAPPVPAILNLPRD